MIKYGKKALKREVKLMVSEEIEKTLKDWKDFERENERKKSIYQGTFSNGCLKYNEGQAEHFGLKANFLRMYKGWREQHRACVL